MKQYKIYWEGKATGRRGIVTIHAKNKQDAGNKAEKRYKHVFVLDVLEIKRK